MNGEFLADAILEAKQISVAAAPFRLILSSFGGSEELKDAISILSRSNTAMQALARPIWKDRSLTVRGYHARLWERWFYSNTLFTRHWAGAWGRPIVSPLLALSGYGNPEVDAEEIVSVYSSGRTCVDLPN